MPCGHCLQARRSLKDAVKAVSSGDYKQAYEKAKETVSHISQSDEAIRVRKLLTRTKRP